MKTRREDTEQSGEEASSERTNTHIYMAKDGMYYSSYEMMAKANKQANEKRMKDLGLDKFRSTPSNKSRGGSSRRNPGTSLKTTTAPTRRSTRLCKEEEVGPPEPKELPTELVYDTPRPAKKRKVTRPVTPETEAVSKQDRQKIGRLFKKETAEWLAEMETYLIENENLSYQNHRSVMRQVEKLSSGHGITYHHWPAGVFFGKGQMVDLTWNLEALYDEACDFEDEHGRDLGNGWLLRHPIRKMNNFQHYLLETKM